MSFEAVVQGFFEKYGTDPVLFVEDVLGVKPDEWQAQVLKWVGDGERRISVRSGHGTGKSSVASWLMIWHLLTRYPQKAVVTAPTITQLQDALASEVKRWINELPDALRSQIEVLTEQIRLKGAPSESFISFRVSRQESPEALSGVHSDWVILVVDEASGVPEQIFEAASGSVSSHNAVTILLGNPVKNTGFFHATHTRLAAYWKTLHISCLNSPRVSQDYIDDMKMRYGEGTNPYRIRVTGDFPLDDEDTIISRELVESAVGRDVEGIGGSVVMGVDIARRGNDASAICVRQGNKIIGGGVKIRKGFDLMQVVGWIRSEMDAVKSSGYDVSECCIDSIGLGAGVCDRLTEEGVDIRGINVSESASIGTEYFNLRSELWWRCRDWFYRRDVVIPHDDRLIEELVCVRRDFNSGDKLKVEAKDRTRQRLGMNASPDAADSLILTFASYASMTTGPFRWSRPLVREMPGIV